MNEHSRQQTISRLIDTSSLPEGGAAYVIEPNIEERRAIAERLEVQSIDSLRGEFAVTAVRGGVDIRLHIVASVGRICVASLEPVTEAIDENIRMQLEKNFDENLEYDDDGDVIKEPLERDEIDIGEFLVQHLSLALAPYPRKEGVESLVDKYRDATSTSPFEALKGLAKRES